MTPTGVGRRGLGVPLALAVLALVGPPLAGPSGAPSVAASAAQLLPPGTRVTEQALDGGGFVRALEIARDAEGLRVRSRDGWRALPGVRPAGEPRSRRLWLGSDQHGRSLLARALAGARTSLLVAALATGLAVALGALVGLVAAVAPLALRATIAVATDGLIGLPRLLLLLMLGTILQGSTAGVALAIGLGSWIEVSRLVEGAARALAGRPFVGAVAAAGAAAPRIAARHLLPNVAPVLVVSAPLVATEAILLESTLSFLGVGGGAAAASWGGMIADGQRLLPAGWWIALFPGLLLSATALAVHSLARAGYQARSARL